jgi:hypothetical protein
MSLKTDELGIPSSFAMARPEYPSFRNDDKSFSPLRGHEPEIFQKNFVIGRFYVQMTNSSAL